MFESFLKSIGQAITAVATAISGAFSAGPSTTPPTTPPPVEERCVVNCGQGDQGLQDQSINTQAGGQQSGTLHADDHGGEQSGQSIDLKWDSSLPTQKTQQDITQVPGADTSVQTPTAPDTGVPTFDAGKVTCDSPENYYLSNARQQFAQIKSSYAGKQIRKKIEGIQLTGTEAEFELLEKVIGKGPSQRWISQASVCQDTMCGMIVAYNSEEVALRSKIIYARYGYIISVDILRSLDGTEFVWPASKVRMMQKSLSVLPSTFYRMSKLKNIYPFSKTQQESVNRTFGGKLNAAGGYYGEWENPHIRVGTEYSDSSFAMYFTHEVAHAYGYTYFSDRIANENVPVDFFNVSWTLSGDRQKAVAISDKGFVSDYAATDPGEDFAESVANFVRFSQRFNKINPAKYQVMRSRVFNNKEYSNIDLMQTDGLKQALESSGGCAAIAATCVDGMKAMRSTTSSGQLFIKDYESSFGYTMKDLPSETVCFEKISPRYEKSFDATQGLGCFKAAKATIDDDLKMACGNELWQGLRSKFGAQ